MSRILLKYCYTIVIISSVSLVNSCYTVVDTSSITIYDSKRAEERIIDNSIIEGTLVYVSVLSNTRNIHASVYPSGFILRNYKWLVEVPENISGRIYVKGNVDSTYINKLVQIKGYYEIPPKLRTWPPDNTSIIYIIARKIYVVK